MGQSNITHRITLISFLNVQKAYQKGQGICLRPLPPSSRENTEERLQSRERKALTETVLLKKILIYFREWQTRRISGGVQRCFVQN